MSDLIQRALITRIEHLEAVLESPDLKAIWALMFPERTDEDFDAAAVLQELRRRGIQERS